jgi:hypothetical protein
LAFLAALLPTPPPVLFVPDTPLTIFVCWCVFFGAACVVLTLRDEELNECDERTSAVSFALWPCSERTERFFFLANSARELDRVEEVVVKLHTKNTQVTHSTKHDKKKKPAFVALLGDNFYPRGISSPRDPQIKRVFTDMSVFFWRSVFFSGCCMLDREANVEREANDISRFHFEHANCFLFS